jgi:hypothetical protein
MKKEEKEEREKLRTNPKSPVSRCLRIPTLVELHGGLVSGRLSTLVPFLVSMDEDGVEDEGRKFGRVGRKSEGRALKVRRACEEVLRVLCV